MDPAHQFAYHAEPWRCHGCVAVARESENWSNPKDARGLMIGVELKGGAHGRR